MMRNRLVLTIIALLSALSIEAVPALKTKKKVTLKDGTTVELTLCGDEHYSFYTDEKGNACQLLENGQLKMLTDEEVTSTWTARKKQREEKAGTGNARRSARRLGKSNATIGKHRGLVILVQFTDVMFVTPNPQQTFQRFFNEEGYHEGGMSGSVRDYFLAQSYGQLEIDFDVVGPYTTAREMAYYGGTYRDPDGEIINDNHPEQMIAEAVDAAHESGVDFSVYDWNKNGEVNQVFVIYAGYAEAQGADENTVWPHEYKLAAVHAQRVYNGVTINTYGCSSELRGARGNTMDGIGTACHEFSHCLGLPDMYDTNKQQNFGMSFWDVMDSGSYNDNSRTPAGYTSYERWFSGWMEPTELKSLTAINDMKPLATTPEAYILYNEKDKDEYYLLENRQPIGFDAGLYGHGLLILHVDYSENAWNSNNLNTQSTHQRMTIIPADNELTLRSKSLAGDPWPGISNNTALTNYTTPAATLYNANKDGQKLMSKPIDSITEDVQNMTVSFVACRPELEAPIPNEVHVVEGGFSVSWPAISGATSYELELTALNKAPNTPEKALQMEESFSKCYSKSTGFTDISSKLSSYGLGGWSGEKLFTSPSMLKIGTSTASGYVKTPTWKVPDSHDITIVLGADVVKAGQTVKGTVELKYGNSGESVSSALRQAVDFQVTTNGKLVFHFTDVRKDYFWLTITPAAQMYLNYLAVYDGIWTEEQLGLTRAAAKRKASEVRTFTTETNSFAFLNVDADKRFVYRVRAQGEANNFSKWSEEQTFEFPEDMTDAIDQPMFNAQSSMFNVQSSMFNGYYDLSGRRVQHPGKGIYIKNGQKVAIK